MSQIVKVFYDLETTGVDRRVNSIHQIAGFIELDGVVMEEFNIKMRPHPKATIEQQALDVCGVTREQILAYPRYQTGKDEFVDLVCHYIDRYNPESKAYLVGFNNRYFDDQFLRTLFELCGDPYINSVFWANSIDVFVLATEFLVNRREHMPSFKLKRVAKQLGLIVDEERLHDALYDIMLTRASYQIIRGDKVEQW